MDSCVQHRKTRNSFLHQFRSSVHWTGSVFVCGALILPWLGCEALLQLINNSVRLCVHKIDNFSTGCTSHLYYRLKLHPRPSESGDWSLGCRCTPWPTASWLSWEVCAQECGDSAGLCLGCWHRNTQQSHQAPGT